MSNTNINNALSLIKPRQYFTLRWMLFRESCSWYGCRGGIIGHETGMGKTYLSLLVIYLDRFLNKDNEKRMPTLVVAGMDAINVWISQMNTHFTKDTFKYIIIREKRDYNVDNILKMNIVFVTYEMLGSVYKYCVKKTLEWRNMEKDKPFEKDINRTPEVSTSTLFEKDEDIILVDYEMKQLERNMIKKQKGKSQPKDNEKKDIENLILSGNYNNETPITNVWCIDKSRKNSFNKDKNKRDGRSFLFNVKWQRIMFDEAHNARNRNSLTFKACIALNSISHWAITATPTQNAISDILSIYRMINYIHPHFLNDGRWVKENMISENFYLNSNALLCSLRKKVRNDEFYSIEYIFSSLKNDPCILNDIWPEGVHKILHNLQPDNQQQFSHILYNKIESILMSNLNVVQTINASVIQISKCVDKTLSHILHKLKHSPPLTFDSIVCKHLSDINNIKMDTSFTSDDVTIEEDVNIIEKDFPSRKRKYDELESLPEETNQCQNKKRKLSEKRKKIESYYIVNSEFDSEAERIIYNYYQIGFVNKYNITERNKKDINVNDTLDSNENRSETDCTLPYNLRNNIKIQKLDYNNQINNTKYCHQAFGKIDNAKQLASFLKVRQACIHPILCLPLSDMDDLDVYTMSDITRAKILEKMKVKWADMSEEDFAKAVTILDKNFVPTKFKHMKVYLDNRVKQDEKIIIYFEHVAPLKLLKSYLQREYNEKILSYCGETQTSDRVNILESFRKDTVNRILLITAQTGSQSLNLHRANHVAFMGPWWNPMRDIQAEGRVKRTGQKRDTNTCYLLISNSVEEVIYKAAVLKHYNNKKILYDTRMSFGTEIMKMDFEVIKKMLSKHIDKQLNEKLKDKSTEVIDFDNIIKQLPTFGLLDSPKIIKRSTWFFIYFPFKKSGDKLHDDKETDVSYENSNEQICEDLFKSVETCTFENYSILNKMEMIDLVYREIVRRL
jgi:SNF2 family DNA or RNA helicase